MKWAYMSDADEYYISIWGGGGVAYILWIKQEPILMV